MKTKIGIYSVICALAMMNANVINASNNHEPLNNGISASSNQKSQMMKVSLPAENADTMPNESSDQNHDILHPILMPQYNGIEHENMQPSLEHRITSSRSADAVLKAANGIAQLIAIGETIGRNVHQPFNVVDKRYIRYNSHSSSILVAIIRNCISKHCSNQGINYTDSGMDTMITNAFNLVHNMSNNARDFFHHMLNAIKKEISKNRSGANSSKLMAVINGVNHDIQYLKFTESENGRYVPTLILPSQLTDTLLYKIKRILCHTVSPYIDLAADALDDMREIAEAQRSEMQNQNM